MKKPLTESATSASIRRRARRAPAFVWAFPVLLVLPAIAIYGQSRYRAPIDP